MNSWKVSQRRKGLQLYLRKIEVAYRKGVFFGVGGGVCLQAEERRHVKARGWIL